MAAVSRCSGPAGLASWPESRSGQSRRRFGRKRMRGWRLVVVFSVVLGFLALGGPAIASPSVPGLPGVQYHACNPDSCVYLTVTRTPTFVKQVSGGGAVTGGNACLYGLPRPRRGPQCGVGSPKVVPARHDLRGHVYDHARHRAYLCHPDGGASIERFSDTPSQRRASTTLGGVK